MQVTGFKDFNFGTWDGGDVYLENSLCVYRRSNRDHYRVTAIGSGSGGIFSINRDSESIIYSVEYSDAGGGYKKLRSGASMPMKGADTSSPNCNGSTNAVFKVNICRK
jgi:hypothetical protein